MIRPLLLILLLIYNLSAHQHLTQEEKYYISNHIVKIGMVKDYYPFSYQENGKIKGFSYEYFKLLASKVNLKYKIEINNWSTTLGKFKNKEIDIIDAISHTKQRESYTLFTEPYFNIPNVIFSRKNSINNYTNLQSLKGKKIGITKDIYYFDIIKNLNLFELVIYKNSREKMKALAHGKIDASFNNLTSGQKYILQGGYTNIEVLDELDHPMVKKEDLRLGITKENSMLYSIMKKAQNLLSNEEKSKLTQKYFGISTNKLDHNDQIQSIQKVADSIVEYVWSYRLDLIIESLKRWLDVLNYKMISFHDQELNEYISVWYEDGIIKHQITSYKPNIKDIEIYQRLDLNIQKNGINLGNISVYYQKVNNNITLTLQEEKYLQSKKTFTMCVDPDWEPYEKITIGGQYVGVASEFIKLIESKIGKKFTLIPTQTWNQSLEYIKKGECEILPFLNQTQNRNRYLNFTPFVYSESEVIIAKNDVTYLDNFTSLHGKTVGLVKGFRTDDYIQKNHPEISIVYIKNHEEGLKLVSQGKIDATINSLLGTAYLIRKLNLANIKIAGKTELFNQYRIGVIKNDPLLHSILTKVILDISQKEKDNILSNWLSVKFENKVDYTLVFQVLFITSVILLIIGYWTYRLNIENRKRLLAEKKLKKLNSELENRISTTINEIQKKEKVLLHQSRLVQMGEMLSMIAHQWRQPIGAINSAVLAINLKVTAKTSERELTPEESKELLNYIIDKNQNITNYIQFLSSTIDDFRDFFKPDIAKETIALSELVDNALKIVEESIKVKNISLKVNIINDITLELHQNELVQVILNLIKNAEDQLIEKNIKYPYIIIEIVKENQLYCINVCDNGGGIPNSIIEKVFDPYFSTKSKNGTGIGLYMSKLLIEDHNNGKLYASNSQEGAVFSIQFQAPKK